MLRFLSETPTAKETNECESTNTGQVKFIVLASKELKNKMEFVTRVTWTDYLPLDSWKRGNADEISSCQKTKQKYLAFISKSKSKYRYVGNFGFVFEENSVREIT